MHEIEEPSWTLLETNEITIGSQASIGAESLSKSIYIHNRLNVEVVITDRDDVRYFCPAASQWTDNRLYISVVHQVHKSTRIDPNGDFYHSHHSGHQAAAYRQAIEKLSEKRYHVEPYYRFCITYSFTKEELMDVHAKYLVDLDLVVNISGNRTHSAHPYGPSAARLTMMENEINQRYQGTFSFSAYIVSNDGSVGDRFMRVGKTVFRIPSVVNHSQRDGFYICAAKPIANSKRVSNGHDQDIIRVPSYEFLSIEEASEKYSLYLTEELASNLGDPKAEHSRELQQLQADLERIRHQRQREKLEYEEEQEEYKRQRKEEELRREEFRREEEERRRQRIADRQETTEWLKFIPVVIGTCLTIASLIIKNSGGGKN